MVKHGLKLQNYYFFLVSNFFVCLILNKNYPAEIPLPEPDLFIIIFPGRGESPCVGFFIIYYYFFLNAAGTH